MGAMLSNLWLAVDGSPIVEWPEESIGDESIIRKEYITASREADVGDVDRIIALHRRHLGRVLD